MMRHEIVGLAMGFVRSRALAPVDVLEEAPPGANAVVLRRILNQCRSSMPAGGRVLLIEFILPREVNCEDPARWRRCRAG
jgi:hypothetical protein